VDVSETLIERLQKQRRCPSGKKRWYTLKAQFMID
jgi:hypothetical protein